MAVEEFKHDPYIASVLLNCAFWVFYGMPFVHLHSILVMTINGVGLVFEFIYLAIFLTYATSKVRHSKMVHTALVRNVIGIIGNVISFGLFFSPAPTFYKIIKNKAVEEFKPDPYIATVLNCAFWVFYGMPFVHPHSILVVTINGVGLVFEFVYLAIFFTYATSKGRRKVLLFLLIEAIFFAAIVLITMLVLHGSHRRSLVVGIICDVFNIMMYVSPLTIMAKVIKTKSVKYMPFWLSLTNFLNGLCWTTFALIHPFDPYLLISNGIGAISGLVQLILYACYCFRGENKDDDSDKIQKPTGVPDSDVEV